jgi:hypothetical protein
LLTRRGAPSLPSKIEDCAVKNGRNGWENWVKEPLKSKRGRQ